MGWGEAVRTLLSTLRLLLVLTFCSLAAQVLLGHNQTLAGIGCAGFFALYLILLFVWDTRHEPAALPNSRHPLKVVISTLHFTLIGALCGTAALMLWGHDHKAAAFGCAGFFLLYFILMLFREVGPSLGSLPHGGSIRYERLEGIGYTAQDGRFCAMDLYSVTDNHRTLRIADRWGFNDGPPITEADLQMILADIVEGFWRNRWAFTVVGKGGEVLFQSRQDVGPDALGVR